MKKMLIIIGISVLVLYLVLSIQMEKEQSIAPAGKTPFAWNQDQLWDTLEETFADARETGCDKLKEPIDSGFSAMASLLEAIAQSPREPGDPLFVQLEETLFHLAPMIGACPLQLERYIALFNRVRHVVMEQAGHWDMNRAESRQRVYRLLYGGRTALEEVMLQAPADRTPSLVKVSDVPSQTPMASILGVNIHSGDILVSRGGAPTSALIARGSDYPGNFSHIALVYVDPKTHLASIIESHIEIGVAISTLEQYLKDKKLRVMVLRLRPDHRALQNDPMLPHKAAEYALKDAQSRHIPYDFAMDYRNPDKLFCSEVASAAYRKFGIKLWMGISSISSKGLASWLYALGVRNFETQEPSDLEYDPQLNAAAEWRDPETLYQDHLDNAVIDIMLEGAEKGDRLVFKWYLLAPARVVKGFSLLLNLFGAAGPIPEGMSAAAALKVSDFSKRYEQVKKQLIQKAEEFKKQNGYPPPYWELIKLARDIGIKK